MLILSCSTGEGHNSCARAVAEVFENHGVDCEVKEALSFVSKFYENVICKGHVVIYRKFPFLFRFGYNYTERHPKMFNEKSGNYKRLARGADRLYKYIKEGGYDAVLCTHVFAALMLTEAKKRYPDLDLPTGLTLTDYTCYPGIAFTNVDHYFIPDISLAEEFAARGIDREKLIATGIPVKQFFYSKTDISSAKEHFGIDVNNTHLLMMCGSMGCGPMKKLTDIIAAENISNVEVSVVCGTNKSLYKKLENKHKNNKNIHIRGFEKEMSLLLDSADLYLTKPGGLSVAEGSAKRIPMVYINAVAGCEEYNRKFFESIGAAKSAEKTADTAKECIAVLKDSAIREKMHGVLVERDVINAGEMIFDTFAKECAAKV